MTGDPQPGDHAGDEHPDAEQRPIEATSSPTLSDVRATADRLRPHLAPTPVVTTWSGVRLKAESLHPEGSFKIRGALESTWHLDPAVRSRGVIAHSSGNHAIAVASAGQRLGIRAVVVMPRDAPRAKLERTRALGAEVHLVGSASDERVSVAHELAAERGLSMIEPYDSLHVVAGTGTISLELFAADPDVTEVYVALSGGGLAAGVASVAHLLAAENRRRVRVIGVEPELAADALASRRAGRIVTLPAEEMARTIADGLRVQQLGTVTWPFVERFVDQIVTVSEDEIRGAMRTAARQARLVVEPSGAVPIAAAEAGRGSTGPAERRAAIVGGGNVDHELLADVLSGR